MVYFKKENVHLYIESTDILCLSCVNMLHLHYTYACIWMILYIRIYFNVFCCTVLHDLVHTPEICHCSIQLTVMKKLLHYCLLCWCLIITMCIGWHEKSVWIWRWTTEDKNIGEIMWDTETLKRSLYCLLVATWAKKKRMKLRVCVLL